MVRVDLYICEKILNVHRITFGNVLYVVYCNYLYFPALGGVNKKLYWSLETDGIETHTPRLYHLSSISKKFRATEILCPHRADLATPFPFSQDDLYQASQPGMVKLKKQRDKIKILPF